MNAQPQLPSIANAKLPGTYTVAKHALAECEKIDECNGWADKSAALASYAKQSKDESLYKLAIRIQARAIRRCGELLKEFEPAKNQHDARADGGPSRTQAAQEAGLSKRQEKTAVRVANVSEKEFEAQVESDSPPTVTALAEQGTQKKPIHDLEGVEPSHFKLATRAFALVDEFSKFVITAPPADVWQGLKEHEKAAFFVKLLAIDEWISLMKLTVNSVSNDILPAQEPTTAAAQISAKLPPERISVLAHQARNLYTQGLSWTEIAKQWNAQGIPTPSGIGQWRGATVAKLPATLDNLLYK